MGNYVYLAGSSLLCLISAAMLIGRRDLVSLTLLYGSIGGFVQVVTSFLYVRDYWSPPTVLGTAVSVEDFLFGFGVTAYPFLVYPVITRKRFAPSWHRNHLGTYLGFGLISAVTLFGGTLVFGANSMVLSLALLALFTTAVCVMRRDLVASAVFAIVFVTTSVTIMYVAMFNLVSPDWWNNHWLLVDSSLDLRILGDVPLLEVLCYITWSGFAATGHPFMFGEVFVGRLDALPAES